MEKGPLLRRAHAMLRWSITLMHFVDSTVVRSCALQRIVKVASEMIGHEEENLVSIIDSRLSSLYSCVCVYIYIYIYIYIITINPDRADGENKAASIHLTRSNRTQSASLTSLMMSGTFLGGSLFSFFRNIPSRFVQTRVNPLPAVVVAIPCYADVARSATTEQLLDCCHSKRQSVTSKRHVASWCNFRPDPPSPYRSFLVSSLLRFLCIGIYRDVRLRFLVRENSQG